MGHGESSQTEVLEVPVVPDVLVVLVPDVLVVLVPKVLVVLVPKVLCRSFGPAPPHL